MLLCLDHALDVIIMKTHDINCTLQILTQGYDRTTIEPHMP